MSSIECKIAEYIRHYELDEYEVDQVYDDHVFLSGDKDLILGIHVEGRKVTIGMYPSVTPVLSVTDPLTGKEVIEDYPESTETDPMMTMIGEYESTHLLRKKEYYLE